MIPSILTDIEMIEIIDEIYELIEDRNHQFSLIEEWCYTEKDNEFRTSIFSLFSTRRFYEDKHMQ